MMSVNVLIQNADFVIVSGVEAKTSGRPSPPGTVPCAFAGVLHGMPAFFIGLFPLFYFLEGENKVALEVSGLLDFFFFGLDSDRHRDSTNTRLFFNEEFVIFWFDSVGELILNHTSGRATDEGINEDTKIGFTKGFVSERVTNEFAFEER